MCVALQIQGPCCCERAYATVSNNIFTFLALLFLAKATVCFMLRRMRPSRSYLASTTGEPAEPAQPHRRYQKRRLNRESYHQVSGSGGSAAVVSRRRPVANRPLRDRSSSPPTYSGRTDTDGEMTVKGSSSGQDWADEDVS